MENIVNSTIALYKAYRKTRCGKRDNPTAMRYRMEAIERTVALSERLQRRDYSFGPYYPFKVYEPKERLVLAIDFEGKVVQHSLCDNVLEPAFSRRFIRDNYAGQIGKGTHDGLDRLAAAMRHYFFSRKAADEAARNQAPTAPSSITVPSEVLGGENLSISWAASTDPDGNLSGYVLERKVGSGTWAQIYKGSARTYTDTITYGWTSVQYRVKAYDAAGAESAYTTSATRTVTNNRPPVISGTDGALGSFSTAAPSYEYTVTDADGHQVDVVEMLDGVTLRSYTVTLGQTNTLTIGSEAWLKVVNGSHTLKIVATDAKDASVTRTLTFTKAVTSIEFEQTLAMEADAMPTKALVNIQGNFPAGCTLQVWICNNGNDASPTWEDITQKARTGQKHYFTNQTKTAAAWGVKVKAKLLRGSATETCYIQSIGGNFA